MTASSSSINIHAILEHLSVSTGVSTQNLGNKIKDEYDFGPLADNQLYGDIVQVLLNCHDRRCSRDADSHDSDVQGHGHADTTWARPRAPSAGTRSMNGEQGSAYNYTNTNTGTHSPSKPMESVVGSSAGGVRVESWREGSSPTFHETTEDNEISDDEIGEEIQEDMQNMSLNQSSAENVADLPNNLLNEFESMGKAHGDGPNQFSSDDLSSPTPNSYSKDEQKIPEEFESPSSFATAKERMDTLERDFSNNGTSTGTSSKNGTGTGTASTSDEAQAETNKCESVKETPTVFVFDPPPPDDGDDSDLFSPFPAAERNTNHKPNFNNGTILTNSLFGSPRPTIPMSPPAVNRASHPNPNQEQPIPMSMERDQFRKRDAPTTTPRSAAVAEPSVTNAGTGMPMSDNEPSVSFKVNLSSKPKDKSTRRSSPRNKVRMRKKNVNINVNVNANINVNVDAQQPNMNETPKFGPSMNFATNVDAWAKTPVAFNSGTSGVGADFAAAKSPEEMELDTPIASHSAKAGANVNRTDIGTGTGNAQPFAHGPLKFNIGAASGTPNRKGLNNWRTNRTKVATRSVPFEAENIEKKRIAEEARMELAFKVSGLRDSAKLFYNEHKYRESILKYTEAIVTLTKNFTSTPTPQRNPDESEMLSSLFGNRAAGLMMVGAFTAAAADCDRAIHLLIEYNPLSLNLKSAEEIVSYLKPDGGLTYRTKFLARMGRAQMKCGRIDEADKTFDETIRVANAALKCHAKIVHNAHASGITFPQNLQQQSERILNQSSMDATLNKNDIKRVRDSLSSIQKLGGVRQAIDTTIAQRNNPELLKHVNTILSISPANSRMQEKKSICLASMRKWSELINFCEIIACKNAESDGSLTEDLSQDNPFPAVPQAHYLNKNGLMDAVENDALPLNPKQASEAVLRLPTNNVKLYLRALRLEEQYTEAQSCIKTLESFAKVAGPIWSPNQKRHKARYHWLVAEKEKVKQTILEKNRGDAYYREGNYQLAADRYAFVLNIDQDGTQYSQYSWELNTMGGRLHAVLHCNRAACLMALKKYDEAAKECTAALKIQNFYMKAILRRARCFNRLERYGESIAEYNIWTQLVEEAKRKPNHGSSDECTFDRAADVSDVDYQKATSERANVEERKLYAELQARQAAEESQRRASSAYNRRQDHYAHGGNDSSRPWDSFGGGGPKRDKKRSPHRRSHRHGGDYKSSTRTNDSSRNKQHRDSPKASPSSNATKCHYAVLQVRTAANQIDIKKAYRKMVLKYHPDKNNNCEKAADTFRKVRQAYETLSDEELKRKYDVERLQHYY